MLCDTQLESSRSHNTQTLQKLKKFLENCMSGRQKLEGHMANRSLRDRCKYFETIFCSTSCPAKLPCITQNIDRIGGCKGDPVCTIVGCPCWQGHEALPSVNKAYKKWKAVYILTHEYNEELELFPN